MPYCFYGFSPNFKVTQAKIANFDPNWVFRESNSRLKSPMALKSCTKLDVAQKRCPIVFRDHQISWAYGPKTQWFESNLSEIAWPVAVIKSLRFALFQVKSVGPPGWPWWCHQTETFSMLLAFCGGNLPLTGEFPAQKPVTRSFDVFSDLRLNKGLSKQ